MAPATPEDKAKSMWFECLAAACEAIRIAYRMSPEKHPTYLARLYEMSDRIEGEYGAEGLKCLADAQARIGSLVLYTSNKDDNAAMAFISSLEIQMLMLEAEVPLTDTIFP